MYNLCHFLIFVIFLIILYLIFNINIEPFNFCTPPCNKYQYCDIRVSKCYPLSKNKKSIFYV